MNALRRPGIWVFVILLASYAFFWHSRDWNTASRLMLTYAVVDRGTIRLDGLDQQTGDKAWFQGHYYSDKLPGYPALAVIPYGIAKTVLRFPDHPLNHRGFAHWPADYWITLGTSGILTALTSVLLVRLASDLGCGPRCAALVGLAYGLATPAYVYATLGYGHQASAFALLAAFLLIWRTDESRSTLRMVAAGFLAAFAAVIELQVGPVSAILGLYLALQVLRGQRTASQLGDFAVGAAIPTLLLLGYNLLAFGSPWDMGYFHHATAMFRDVHSASNPTGLEAPHWERAGSLLWGGYRGLLFYAPILLLAVPGWVVLLVRGRVGLAIASAAICGAVFLVNLSYPEWTGGWSTGPRLLLPLIPFAMIPVAALLAAGGRRVTVLAIVLAVAGGLLLFLFQAVGARIRQDVRDPLLAVVLPLWKGNPLPAWWPGERFVRNPVALLLPETLKKLPAAWLGIQFIPLIAAQTAMLLALFRGLRPRKADDGSDQRVDQK